MFVPSFRRFSVHSLFAIAAAGGLSVAASADLSTVIFRVTATNSQGSGVFEATSDQGSWNGDTYVWQGGGITITSPQGDLIATLASATFRAQSDPVVGLIFDVQAGASDTHFVIDSGLLSFPAFGGATASASAGLTVTDADGVNLATATGLGGANGDRAYQAHYNGLVPAGTLFRDFIPQVQVATLGGSATAFDNSGGFQPIGGLISSMSTRYDFNLTANDTASGTSVFVVVPEPACVALLGLGVLFIRRRA